jgi:hypothetical protein
LTTHLLAQHLKLSHGILAIAERRDAQALQLESFFLGTRSA